MSLGHIFQAAASLFDNAKSRREEKKAREYNFNMWEAENAYNDPAAQMERLKNAGLNPNLVYGNGATTLAARSTPAQPLGNNGLSDAVAKGLDFERAYQALEQVDAQIQNVRAQNQLIKSQILQSEASADEIRSRADIARHNYNLVKGTKMYVGEHGVFSLLNRFLNDGGPSSSATDEVLKGSGKIIKDKNGQPVFDPKLQRYLRESDLVA